MRLIALIFLHTVFNNCILSYIRRLFKKLLQSNFGIIFVKIKINEQALKNEHLKAIVKNVIICDKL